ncbi:MAG: P-II family nitrogen regulator, partial [Lachnospiraceae bacterium]|nr:P-II family nitrogen regulator [Lachnospiraceae bacterium]
MGNLYLMTTIVDRKIANKYLELYKANDLQVFFIALGFGTASNEILDYLGLDSADKAVAFTVLEESTWITVKKQL